MVGLHPALFTEAEVRHAALPRSPFDFAQGRLSTAVGMTPRGKGETGQAGRHKNEDGDVKIAAKAKPKMAP